MFPKCPAPFRTSFCVAMTDAASDLGSFAGSFAMIRGIMGKPQAAIMGSFRFSYAQLIREFSSPPSSKGAILRVPKFPIECSPDLGHYIGKERETHTVFLIFTTEIQAFLRYMRVAS